MGGFLDHLLHDPIRDNPWSFLLTFAVIVSLFCAGWWLAGRRRRR